jgi:hypothetical protein
MTTAPDLQRSLRALAEGGKLEWHVREFQRTGQAFHAAEGYALAHAAGMEVPADLQRWVGKAMSSWLDSGGSSDLTAARGSRTP